MSRDEWVQYIMKLIRDMENDEEIKTQLQEMYGAALKVGYECGQQDGQSRERNNRYGQDIG